MAAELDDKERRVRLLERRLRTATNDETHTTETTVHCPLSRMAVRVSHCEQCPRFLQQLEAGARAFVECRMPEEIPVHQAMAGELLSPEVTCLDAELAATRAVELLALSGVTSAPVLDDNSVLIGVVSASALARLQHEAARIDGFHVSDQLEVEDAMSTEVVTLPQHATVGEVARLMAERQLDQVPIVTDDGHLVGVLSASDLVRWLATWAP